MKSKISQALLLLATFAVPAPAALVAHYTFDTNANDSSGSGYHATLHNDASINGSGGRFGGALALDGVNDFASTHNGTSATWSGISGADARSIGLWIKAEGGAQASSANDILVGWGDPGAGSRVRFDFGLGNSNDSLLRAELNAGFAQSSAATTNLRNGEWHHVAVTFTDNGTSATFYVNGKLENTASFTSTPLVTTTTGDLGIYIGTGVREGSGANGLDLQSVNSGNLARFFQGLIDDVGIWSSALGATEIALVNGLGRIGDNDLSTLAAAATLWGGVLDDTAVINGATWQKVAGLTGSPGDWSQVGGDNGAGSFVVLDASGGGIQIIPEPSAALLGLLGGLALFRRRR